MNRDRDRDRNKNERSRKQHAYEVLDEEGWRLDVWVTCSKRFGWLDVWVICSKRFGQTYQMGRSRVLDLTAAAAGGV